MIPVRTDHTNLVLTAPEGNPEVEDLPAQRLEDGSIASVWWLTPLERDAVAAGANVALIVQGATHPPVWLTVVDQVGVGEDAPDKREHAELVALRDVAEAAARVRPASLDGLGPEELQRWSELAAALDRLGIRR